MSPFRRGGRREIQPGEKNKSLREKIRALPDQQWDCRSMIKLQYKVEAKPRGEMQEFLNCLKREGQEGGNPATPNSSNQSFIRRIKSFKGFSHQLPKRISLKKRNKFFCYRGVTKYVFTGHRVFWGEVPPGM